MHASAGVPGTRSLPYRSGARRRHLAAWCLALWGTACGRSAVEGPAPGPPAPVFFTEITERVGLDPEDRAPSPPSYFLPEIMGAGLAVADVTGDGRLDVILPMTPPPGRPEEAAANRLYIGRPDGTFVEEAGARGLADPGFGQGIAVADVDRDGDLDVFFANLGPDALYRNDGRGRFRRTQETWPDQWSTSATFCDYDGDGWVDLYVVHYLRVDYRGACPSLAGTPDYCGPQSFQGVADRLYRNLEGRGFEDVTARVGLASPEGGVRAKGLGVLCLDLTGDGRLDFYVANDGEPNQLWVQQPDGTFQDEALGRGLAVNLEGEPEASMGLCPGDVDADGRLDLWVTHLALETNTLYRDTGGAIFEDRTPEAGAGLKDLPYTGFGCALVDLDHDGDLDLAVANGAVRRGLFPTGTAAGDPWAPYREPNLLFINDGTGRFEDASTLGGTFTARRGISRGLAAADWDGDGDLDLFLTELGGVLRVFRNDAPAAGHRWVRLELADPTGDVRGAVVRLESEAGRRWTLPVVGESSYQVHQPPAAHIGLGAIEAPLRAQVRWPDGGYSEHRLETVDQVLLLVRGRR